MQEIRFSRFSATILGLVLVTMLGIPAWGQPEENVSAGYQHFWIHGVPDETTRLLPTVSLAADAELIGQLRWNLSMDNNYSLDLPKASFTISSGIAPSCFQGGAVPVMASIDPLATRSSLKQEFSSSFESCNYLRTFTPGFDSIWTVSPLVIPRGGGHQTLTIKVTPRDDRYRNDPAHPGSSNIGFLLFGNVESVTCPPEIDPNVESCSGGGSGLNNPQINKTYTFTVVFHVESPDYAIYSKPSVAIIMSKNGPGTAYYGYSERTLDDPLIAGSFKFAVDGLVTWHMGIQENWNLTYGGLSERVPDDTPPEISGLPSACTLWPPNHKLVRVATVSAVDSGSGLASLNVTGTSNEPDNGLGDGDTPNDIQISGSGLGPYTVQLRAERSGTLSDRVYTLTATATDLAGNTTTANATCTVPHNR